MNTITSTFIEKKLAEKARLFTAELGEGYQAMLRKQEELFAPNGEKWTDIWLDTVEELKMKIKETEENIANLTKQLQDMVIQPEMSEMFFGELRGTLMDEIELKDRLLKELEEAERTKKEKIATELDVTHTLAAYPKNRFEQALAWMEQQQLSFQNGHCVDMSQVQPFLETVRVLETLMQLTPYALDFDIAPYADKYGIHFTSLQIGDVTLKPKPYTIRFDVSDWHKKIQSQDEVKDGGFDKEHMDAEQMRAKFGEWSVSFEWFRTITSDVFIHSLFFRNRTPKDEKDAFICLSVHPYIMDDGKGMATGLEIRGSFKPFPNSI